MCVCVCVQVTGCMYIEYKKKWCVYVCTCVCFPAHLPRGAPIRLSLISPRHYPLPPSNNSLNPPTPLSSPPSSLSSIPVPLRALLPPHRAPQSPSPSLRPSRHLSTAAKDRGTRAQRSHLPSSTTGRGGEATGWEGVGGVVGSGGWGMHGEGRGGMEGGSGGRDHREAGGVGAVACAVKVRWFGGGGTIRGKLLSDSSLLCLSRAFAICMSFLSFSLSLSVCICVCMYGRTCAFTTWSRSLTHQLLGGGGSCVGR